MKVTTEVDFDGTIDGDNTGLSLGGLQHLRLRRFRANALSNHPFRRFKHVHFMSLLAKHLPAELDNATSFAAAEVLVDIGRQTDMH